MNFIQFSESSEILPLNVKNVYSQALEAYLEFRISKLEAVTAGYGSELRKNHGEDHDGERLNWGTAKLRRTTCAKIGGVRSKKPPRMTGTGRGKLDIWYFRYARGKVESPIVTLNQLGHLLQEIRCQRGLTQRQLGQRAGFAQSAISALESNPGSAKLERIFQLLAALDLEIVLRERKNHPHDHEW